LAISLLFLIKITLAQSKIIHPFFLEKGPVEKVALLGEIDHF
jgi:hypothetical protein